MNRLTFLPVFVVCFCMGICLIRLVNIPLLFLYIFAWILSILGFVFVKHKSSIWLLLLLATLLGGLFLSNTYILPYPHIRNFTFYKSESVIIRGVVSNSPQISPIKAVLFCQLRNLPGQERSILFVVRFW